MAIEKYYSAKQVLVMLKISSTTLYRLQLKGELTPIKIGRLRRFAESDIIRFLERRKQAYEKVQNQTI